MPMDQFDWSRPWHSHPVKRLKFWKLKLGETFFLQFWRRFVRSLNIYMPQMDPMSKSGKHTNLVTTNATEFRGLVCRPGCALRAAS